MGIKKLGLLALQIASVAALRMAALGSSYAAGPGLAKGANYASIVAQKLELGLTDLSVSGSTLLNMGSQIVQIPANTDIVTVTSGGNDLGYIGGLIQEAAGFPPSGPLIGEEELVYRFNLSIRGIFERAPNARLFLVEYLSILGPDVVPGRSVPFNRFRVAYHQSIAATLKSATEKAAQGRDRVTVVSVADGSLGHGLGSADPWVNGATGRNGDGDAWHPNAAGMKAVAGFLGAALNLGSSSPPPPPPVTVPVPEPEPVQDTGYKLML